MAATRIETDLLGVLEVPADAYYGIHTVRALDNFQISGNTIGQSPNMVRAYAIVKKAAASANRDLGVLAASKAGAIVAACDRLDAEAELTSQFPLDVFQGGAGTSVNMNVNEVIANLALEELGRPKGEYSTLDPNDDVNMSQSTNDSYPTAFRLALLMSTRELGRTLEILQDAFERKSREFAGVLKLGRTQLQDAVPMTLGQEFAAFAVLISEDPTWATFLGFGLVGFLTWGFVRVWGWLGALMWGREPACAHREDGVGRDCCADCLVEACW